MIIYGITPEDYARAAEEYTGVKPVIDGAQVNVEIQEPQLSELGGMDAMLTEIHRRAEEISDQRIQAGNCSANTFGNR